MNVELLSQLRAAQQELDPQFKALRSAVSALNHAFKLAGDEVADAFSHAQSLAQAARDGLCASQ